MDYKEASDEILALGQKLVASRNTSISLTGNCLMTISACLLDPRREILIFDMIAPFCRQISRRIVSDIQAPNN